MPLRTRRLTLIPASLDLVQAELRSPTELGTLLGAVVPASWPPELYDRVALEYWIGRLEEDPGHEGWAAWYFVMGDSQHGHVVVGAGGYKGKPDMAGSVEIGYSVLPDYRQQSIGRSGAVSWRTRSVMPGSALIAETLPGGVDRASSARTFPPHRRRHEPVFFRYELTRTDYTAGSVGLIDVFARLRISADSD